MEIVKELNKKTFQKVVIYYFSGTGNSAKVAALIYIFSLLLVVFYKYFNILFFPIENDLLKFVLESMLMVSFMGLWYRIVHYLLKVKALERLTVYTSLTKYKWWGRRYKALKNI